MITIPCEETIQIWLQNLTGSIKEELEEVNSAISNERLWIKGCLSGEEKQYHRQNLADLEEFAKRLKLMAS